MLICIKNKEEFIKIRIMLGYSQRKLGRKIGITGAYLSQIERGDRNPSPTVAKKISEALGKEFSALFFIKGVCKCEQAKTIPEGRSSP